MSDQTRRALEESLAAHVADENDGAIVTGWVVSVSMNTLEGLDNGETGYMTDNPLMQPLHSSLGLAEISVLAFRENYRVDE